jgi:hypothetical protein
MQLGKLTVQCADWGKHLAQQVRIRVLQPALMLGRSQCSPQPWVCQQ